MGRLSRPVRSYIGRLVARPGERFINGHTLLDSARFNAHADAAAWTEAMQAGPIAARKVIASVREPEIVRHCPDGDPGSVGSICPWCRIKLTPRVIAGIAPVPAQTV